MGGAVGSAGASPSEDLLGREVRCVPRFKLSYRLFTVIFNFCIHSTKSPNGLNYTSLEDSDCTIRFPERSCVALQQPQGSTPRERSPASPLLSLEVNPGTPQGPDAQGAHTAYDGSSVRL